MRVTDASAFIAAHKMGFSVYVRGDGPYMVKDRRGTVCAKCETVDDLRRWVLDEEKRQRIKRGER